MKLDFMRTAARSYMIVKDAGFAYEEFELQMQLNNRIPGLLNLQVICSGGKFDYWYDITGLQSMEILLGVKPVEKDMLLKYVQEICDERMILENYLLDAEDLVFLPDMLFQDKGTQKLCFCCIPGYHTVQENGLKIFLEEILKKADHSDPQTVKIMYELYERCADGMVSIEDLLKTAELREPSSGGLETEENNREKEAAFGQPKGRPDDLSEESVRFWKRPEKKAAVFQAGSAEENGRSHRKADSKTFRSSRRPADNAGKVQEKSNRKTERTNEKKTRKKRKKQKKAYDFNYAGMDDIDWLADGYDEVPPEYTDKAGSEETSEKTMYMPMQSYKAVLKLVYCGDGQEENMVLDHFPFCIGKNPQQADGVIGAESVSRIHACIRQSDGEYLLEDMNSTNGTYLNHEILPYHTPVPVKVNDHVTFGTEEFVVSRGYQPG